MGGIATRPAARSPERVSRGGLSIHPLDDTRRVVSEWVHIATEREPAVHLPLPRMPFTIRAVSYLSFGE